ncbi:uncharacterized protein ZBIST_3882 [Zygosaccharomyces bailii]|nr:uncharacterized protein ZBIST_3882 [Zygosaccharomyces bailii]
MSNHLLTANGTLYPVNDLTTYEHGSTANGEVSFNQTACEKHGTVYINAQQAWNIYFDCAAFTSAITWILLFGRKDITSSLKKLKEKFLIKKNINKLYNDRLNDIQSQYEEVPLAIGAFDELLYGVMVQNQKSHKHSAGA